MKTATGKIMLAILASGLAVGGSELGLRWFWPISKGPDMNGITVRDDARGYRFIPHSSAVIHGAFNDYTTRIDINAHGYRFAEVPVEKPPDGTIRIALLGDSEVFGCGVAIEEAMHTRLAEQLNQAPPPRYQVLNFGLPGLSPLDQEKILAEILPVWKPDLAVSIITVANDLYDCRQAAIRAGVIPDPPAIQSPRSFWKESQVGRLMKYKMLPRLPDFLTPRASWFGEEPPFLKQWFLDENLDSAFKLMTDALRRMKGRCDQAGCRLLLTNVPARSQFDPEIIDIVSRAVSREHFDLLLSDQARPQRMLRAFADQAGIPYIIVLPFFQELANQQHLRLKYPNDGHLNARGTLEMARRIAEHIQADSEAAEGPPATVTD